MQLHLKDLGYCRWIVTQAWVKQRKIKPVTALSNISCMWNSDRLGLFCFPTYIMLLLNTNVHCVLQFRKIHTSSHQKSAVVIGYRVVYYNQYDCFS